MTATVSKIPPGNRVKIEEDEGAVETRVSPVLDVAQFNDFITVWEPNIGDFVEGQAVVSASVIGNAGVTHEWTAIECRAVGWLGAKPSIVAVWFLTASRSVVRWPFANGENYDRLGFEARPIVNGTPGPGSLPPVEAKLSIALKLWR